MTPRETVDFVRDLSKLFPSFEFDPETPGLWYEAGLRFVAPQDAREAALSLAQRSTWVALNELFDEVRRIRRLRTDRVPEPLPAADPDQPAAYRAELAASIRRIADGHHIGRALAAAERPCPDGPPPAYWQITRRTPDDPNDPARRIPCPWPPCQARPGEPCRTASGRRLGYSHEARKVAAGLIPPTNPPRQTGDAHATTG